MMIAPPMASRPYKAPCGPFKHLDLLDVEQFLVELVGIGLQHAIDQHGDRGLAVARLRDAADGDEGVADVLRLDQGHVRHHGDEVARAFDSGRLNLLRREHVHGDRHALKDSVALARRDHDFLEVAAGAGGAVCARVGIATSAPINVVDAAIHLPREMLMIYSLPLTTSVVVIR